VSDAQTWVMRAWKEQREFEGWERPNDYRFKSRQFGSIAPLGFKKSQPLEVDQFFFVHLVLCLPSSWAKNMGNDADFLSYHPWERPFNDSHIRVSVLWIPPRINQLNWRYSSRWVEETARPLESEKTILPSSLSQQVINWLVTSVVEELSHD